MSSIESKIEALVTADDLPERLEIALHAGHQVGPQRAWGRGEAEPPDRSPLGASPKRARPQRTRPQPHATRMSPELSYGRHAGPAPHTARPAAVVLLLFRRGGRWHLPLTERPATLTHHAGQISLPGGAVDAGEPSSEAALRELKEELGFAAPVEILGRLADCYVFASDFLVTPWVVATSEEPHWWPQEREVQDIVELPLDVLLDEQAIGRLTVERGPLVFHAPCIRIGETRIWGATSIILSELADVLRHLLETAS